MGMMPDKFKDVGKPIKIRFYIGHGVFKRITYPSLGSQMQNMGGLKLIDMLMDIWGADIQLLDFNAHLPKKVCSAFF